VGTVRRLLLQFLSTAIVYFFLPFFLAFFLEDFLVLFWDFAFFVSFFFPGFFDRLSCFALAFFFDFFLAFAFCFSLAFFFGFALEAFFLGFALEAFFLGFDFDAAFGFAFFAEPFLLWATSFFATAMIAFARTVPNPGTALKEFTSLEAIFSAERNPLVLRVSAVAGPIPEILVTEVGIRFNWDSD